LFCDQKTSFSQIRLRLRPNLSSEIRPNSASAEFEKVKFGATLEISYVTVNNVRAVTKTVWFLLGHPLSVVFVLTSLQLTDERN